MLGFVIAGRVSHVRKGEDPKKFFSYLKSKTSNRVSGGPLVRKEGMVTDNREIAEIMNAQYAWFVKVPSRQTPSSCQELTLEH